MLALILIQGSFIFLFYTKADEITRDPCSICAERMGENVICKTTGDVIPAERIYYPNGTIKNVIRKINDETEINITQVKNIFKQINNITNDS